MTQIRIDGITGVTYPVDLYVADIYGNNRYFLATISSGPVPPELAYTTLPAIFDNAPSVMLIMIDVNDCQTFEILPCSIASPTPTPTFTQTPSITPTNTITPTITPTTTPTPSITPSITPTLSITPSVTATLNPTPSVTETTTPTVTPSLGLSPTPTVTETITPTITPTPTETETPTPTPSVTPTFTPTETETPTPTPTVTTSITPTISLTPTFTPTPSETPAITTFAYLFIDVNAAPQRNPLATYMVSQGSTWGGFNVGNPLGGLSNNPVTQQQRFNSRFNSYISYSGWGVTQPTILTAPISNMSRGVDAFGVPIVAGRFQTTVVTGTTLPVAGGQSAQAWYTWFVPTGATPGQAYTSISMSRSSTQQQQIAATQNFYSRVVNYTGSTNIPAGYYRVYTSYSQNGLRPRLNGQNFYFRGGNGRINV